MGAQAELRGVGLADEDRPRRAQALHGQGVGGGDEILVDRRALGGPEALDRGQVLDRVGEAMEQAQGLLAGELVIAGLGLLQQVAAIAQRDDGVDRGIEPLDLVQVSGHGLDAGDLAGADRGGEPDAAEFGDLGHAGRRQGGATRPGEAAGREGEQGSAVEVRHGRPVLRVRHSIAPERRWAPGAMVG